MCVRVLRCSVMSDSLWPHGLQPTRLLCPWGVSGKNTGVGCHALPGIFLMQELKLHLLHLLKCQVDFLPLAPHGKLTYFIHSINSVCVSMPISQFIPLPSFPLGVHTFFFAVYMSISALQIKSSIWFSWFHTYVLIYIWFSFSDLLHPVWQSLCHSILYSFPPF